MEPLGEIRMLGSKRKIACSVMILMPSRKFKLRQQQNLSH